MSKVRTAATAMGVLVVLSLVAVMQQNVLARQAGTDLILVPVSVSDSKNVPVTNLKREDFQLLEDNKEQQITQFTNASDPVTLGVVLGLSARGPVKTPGQTDRVSVDILKAVDRVREAHPAGAIAQSPFDGDSMFDVVSKGMDALAKQSGPKKAMAIVSDGYISSGSQTSSVPMPKSLIEASKTAPFPIFFLFPSTSTTPPAFTDGSAYAVGYYLEQMADFSGGDMITGVIENDLSKVASDLRDRVKNLYVLGFRSPNTAKDGKWRKLAVKVPASGSKVKIASKSRYFVPKG